jgi:hypothetical protein
MKLMLLLQWFGAFRLLTTHEEHLITLQGGLP